MFTNQSDAFDKEITKKFNLPVAEGSPLATTKFQPIDFESTK
jgi:hypothetical protein